jgi:hypothetical protein
MGVAPIASMSQGQLRCARRSARRPASRSSIILEFAEYSVRSNWSRSVLAALWEAYPDALPKTEEDDGQIF